ncbi:MAG: MarR family transcriptional regulator [Pseudomonadota bacterium]
MFFLKELPTLQMIEGYGEHFPAHGAQQVLSKLTFLREASLLQRRLDTYFSEHGFSQLRFLALVVIDREIERDELSHGEITERLDVSKPVVTRTLNSLTDEGLLRVSRREQDGRTKVFELTQQGRKKLAHVFPGYFAILHADG